MNSTCVSAINDDAIQLASFRFERAARSIVSIQIDTTALFSSMQIREHFFYHIRVFFLGHRERCQ